MAMDVLSRKTEYGARRNDLETRAGAGRIRILLINTVILGEGTQAFGCKWIQQVEEHLVLFPHESIYVVFFEESIDNPGAGLNGILEFFGRRRQI